MQKILHKDYKTKYTDVPNDVTTLVDCPYFTTNLIPFTGEMMLNHDAKDSFVIYMCVKGNVTFETHMYNDVLKFGETLLVPATLKNLKITADEASELLEVYIK